MPQTDPTLRYYESLLRYLRSAGREFSAAHPDRARSLGLSRDRAEDPAVERLFEGMAFLMGRVEQRLDDDLPELTEGLVNMLWPQYLRMIPSLTVVKLVAQRNTLQHNEMIQAGLQIQSLPIIRKEGNLSCLYRTTQAVQLMPLVLQNARIEQDGSGRSRICFDFLIEAQAKRDTLDLSRLRLFFSAPDPVAFTLRHVLLNDVLKAEVRCNGQIMMNMPIHTEEVGLSKEERLWPHLPNGFDGYRLLLEYFCFRRKFCFVDVCGFDILQLPENKSQFSIEITLTHPYPSEKYFDTEDVHLYCAHNAHSEIRLSYNSEGLLAKEQFYLLKEPIRYDVIQRDNYLHSQTTEYQYDVLGNRSQTLLPTGDVLNYLYYGSGHLHHINFNGETITDIERDNLHRPIVRSAGQLNTQFQFDPMGRLKQQISQLAQYDSSNQSALIGRQYHYDTTGNLIRTDDKLNGNTDYAYDPLGRILQAADERFAFDPAHNISDDGQTVMGNRLMEYNGVRYRYDGLGNLTERHSDTESQFYRYDADNQLIEARIEKATMPTQYWQYRYDPFGRRISKTNAKTQQNTQFVWEGSRLLQEIRQDKVYTYVYTEQNSYEPLAQIETFRQPEKHKTDVKPTIYYYHTDQIGIPREMTDETGKIVWQGRYSAWGKLTAEEKANSSIHQPFRLQNQYADEETGLHYNFFRYYDAHCGRFTQQDPIGLLGGDNLYTFARNAMGFIDPIGLYAMILPLLPEIGAGAVAAGKAVLGVIGVVAVASSLSSDTAKTQTKTGNCSGSKCNNNNSCKVKYATVPLCDDLAKQGYIFNSLNQLFNHYRMQARKHSEAIATKGPCRGQGKHINLRSKDNGSVKVGTAASCNCCKDDAAGNAQLKTVFAKLN